MADQCDAVSILLYLQNLNWHKHISTRSPPFTALKNNQYSNIKVLTSFVEFSRNFLFICVFFHTFKSAEDV